MSRWVILLLVLAITACGGRAPVSKVSPSPAERSPEPTSQSPSPTSIGSAPSCIAIASPPPSSTWKTYSDSTYAFSISYPPAFTFEPQHGVPGTAIVMLYRVVDSCYLDRYPPGQVEIGVFTKDADTPTAWVQAHSDPDCGIPGSKAFIFGVSNLKSMTVAGHDGVSFDQKSRGCGGPASTGQATAFFLNSKYVFMLGWWTGGPDYAPTVQAIASQMLTTFKG